MPSKWINICEKIIGVFLGVLLFLVVVGGIFAILSHFMKSEIAGLIGSIVLAMLAVTLTTQHPR